MAVLFIVVMTALGVNGSSVGMLRDDRTETVAAFQPRVIRGDEWRARTPLVVRQSFVDFADSTTMAVGEHETGVFSDLPTRTVDVLMRPTTVAYFVLSVERGFALEWWLTIVGPFIGVYVLLLVLTGRVGISTSAALLVMFAPVLSWWASPGAGLPVMYGGIACAAVLLALRRRRFWPCWSVGAGWAAAAATSSLYMPWLAPFALVFACVLAAAVSTRRLRELVVPLGISAGVGGALIGMFVLRHRDALITVARTVYPGHRAGRSGEMEAMRLFGAPFDTLATGRKAAAFFFVNQSEASSGMMLWLPIILAGGTLAAVGHWRSTGERGRVLAALSVLCLVMAAWATLPVPSIVGKITLLDQTHSSRLAWPLTVASALLVGMYLAALADGTVPRPDRHRINVAVAVFGGITAWSAGRALVDDDRPDRTVVFIIIIAVVVATWLMLSGRASGVLLAVLVIATSTVRINPVQVGLDPILDAPLFRQVQSLAADDPTGTWIVAGDDQVASALVVASGVPTTEGLSWWPDADAWRIFDPSDEANGSWNRLAGVSFLLVPGTVVPLIGLPAVDQIQVTVDPCDPTLADLHVRWVVSADEIDAECLVERDTPTDEEERHIYERVDG